MCAIFYFLIRICTSYVTAGTETAVENVTLFAAGTDYISLSWNKLKYIPISFEQLTQCFLECESKNYYVKHSTIPSGKNFITIRGLKPGSICEIHLLALFNPAMLDLGTEHFFQTHPSSK